MKTNYFSKKSRFFILNCEKIIRDMFKVKLFEERIKKIKKRKIDKSSGILPKRRIILYKFKKISSRKYNRLKSPIIIVEKIPN